MEQGQLVDQNRLALAGGQERTREEFGGLFAAAGFQVVDATAAGAMSVIEGAVRAGKSTRGHALRSYTWGSAPRDGLVRIEPVAERTAGTGVSRARVPCGHSGLQKRTNSVSTARRCGSFTTTT